MKREAPMRKSQILTSWPATTSNRGSLLRKTDKAFCLRRILERFFLTGLLFLSLCIVAHAADTVINFDNLPPDTPVDTQYHSQGVDFGFPPYASLPASSQVPPAVTCCSPIIRAAPPNHASQVLDISSGRGEFFTPGVFGAFSGFHQRLQVSIGNNQPGITVQVTLSAYDIMGALVAPPVTNAVNGVPVTVSVTSEATPPNIAYFLVQADDFNRDLWIDDLTYDNPVSLPADFTFDLQGLIWSGSAIYLAQGESRTIPLPIRRLNGSNGDVAFSARLPPLSPAVKATVAPNPLPGTDTSAALTLTADVDALVTDTTVTVTGVPAGPSVAPAPRSAQLLLTIVAPIQITTSGAGLTYDLVPCIPLQSFPIYVLKTPTVVAGDVTLELRILDNSGGTRRLPDFITATFDPPVSQKGSVFTVHNLKISYKGGGSAEQLIPLIVQGSDGNTAVLSQPFFVQIKDSGSIDTITPFSGIIPNRILGRPGTHFTITGTGFCPSASVQFGNPSAVVSADSVTPTKILATVPFFATEGPSTAPSIQVNEPGYIVINHPEASRHVPIDSIRNTVGFQFHNYFPHTTFGQLTAAFGSDQTEDQVPLCWPFDCTVTIHDPNAILWLNFLKSFTDVEGSGGACFGNALAAQRLLSGQKARSDFPPRGAATNFELDGESRPSVPLEEYINSQSTVQLSVEYLNDYRSQSFNNSFGQTRDVLLSVRNNIRDALAAGEMPLIALRFGSFPPSGHVVTAYDVEDVSSDPIEYRINVWDSNLPFEKPGENDSGAVHVDKVTKSQIHVAADGTWSLASTPATGFINELIVTRASAIPTSPTLIGSLPATGDLTIFGAVGGASHTVQLSDNSGRTLFGTDGKLNTDIHTRLKAVPFSPLVNKPTPGEVFLVAPENRPIVQRVVGARSGIDVHLLSSGGLSARVESKALPNVPDQIGFHPNGTIGFSTEASEKPLIMGLIAHSEGVAKSAEIETTNSKGTLDELLFDDKRTMVTLRHGGLAAPLRLRLSTLAKDGGPISFDSGPLHVSAGGWVTLAPLDWTRLDTVLLTTRDLNGDERQTILKNRASKELSGSIEIDVDRSRKGPLTRLIDVFGQLKGIPEDSEAWITFIVRHNDGIVAHSTQSLSTDGINRHRRLGRFEFVAPASGRYDAEVAVFVRTDRGVIPTVRTSSKSTSFYVAKGVE
jgi:hypothetical protein